MDKFFKYYKIINDYILNKNELLKKIKNRKINEF